MSANIRLAKVSDAAQIAAIYAPYCLKTPISFEEVAPDVAEMTRRMERIQQRWPWVVFDDGGAILGYAYAGQYRERAAYRWSVEVTVYVAEGAHRRGIGRRLYESLFRILVLQGYFRALAGVTVPNPASEGMHRAVGFEPIGTYHSVGYKMGAWHDVRWFERTLQPTCLNPPEPKAVEEVIKSDG